MVLHLSLMCYSLDYILCQQNLKMKLSTVLNVSLFFRVERIVVEMSDMEEDKPKVTITLRTIVTGPEAGSIIGRGGEVVNSIR